MAELVTFSNKWRATECCNIMLWKVYPENY
jgi:hypothetical protein